MNGDLSLFQNLKRNKKFKNINNVNLASSSLPIFFSIIPLLFKAK